MKSWDPELYLKFKNERTQPSLDLVSRIDLQHPKSIIDIGCGPGNSTQVLRAKWPDTRIAGVDNSEEMILKARKDFPNEQWILADAATRGNSEKYDIVFSNAALQWIPNHDSLLPRLFGMVRDGGVFAVQVPNNQDSPLHQALIQVAESSRWKSYMGGHGSRFGYQNPEFYYDTLAPFSARFDLWETIYYHVMDSPADIVEWYKGTGMRPFLERLPADEREAFASDVLNESRAHYPTRSDGKVLYPFRRLFFIAYRSQR